MNPCKFKQNDIIISIHSGMTYKVIEPDKHGMAKLHNINLNTNEDWNAYNNNHFVLSDNQLSLTFIH